MTVSCLYSQWVCYLEPITGLPVEKARKMLNAKRMIKTVSLIWIYSIFCLDILRWTELSSRLRGHHSIDWFKWTFKAYCFKFNVRQGQCPKRVTSSKSVLAANTVISRCYRQLAFVLMTQTTCAVAQSCAPARRTCSSSDAALQGTAQKCNCR